MDTIKKFYKELQKNDGEFTHIRVELYYALGGMNYFTYKNEPRGYYVSVSPVERSNKYGVMMESCHAFTGMKQCIKTVARKSKKAEAEAIANFDKMAEIIQNAVLSENNLKLA